MPTYECVLAQCGLKAHTRVTLRLHKYVFVNDNNLSNVCTKNVKHMCKFCSAAKKCNGKCWSAKKSCILGVFFMFVIVEQSEIPHLYCTARYLMYLTKAKSIEVTAKPAMTFVCPCPFLTEIRCNIM